MGTKLTKQANWHPADVVAAVQKAGSSLSELARVYRKHPSSFSNGLRRALPEVNRAIAKLLGARTNEIWPEWYDEEGNRRRRREPMPKSTKGTSQNSGSYTDRRSAA